MKKNLIVFVFLSVSFLLVVGNAHIAVSQTLKRGEYTIQQKSNQKNKQGFVDAYEDAGKDYGLVTRPWQANDTQRWVIRAVH